MEYYFQLIEKQRLDFYSYMEEAVYDPWKQPAPNKWSVTETMYHLMLLARLVRRFSAFYIPVMLPYAHWKKDKPFKKEIHNIYNEYKQVKKKAMKAPFVLTPPKNLKKKYSINEIQQLLQSETAKLKKMLVNMDEPIAGHIRYPDPVAYYPNIIQSIHLLAIHEQHHFDLYKKYHQKENKE